jgi:hypothetical protein
VADEVLFEAADLLVEKVVGLVEVPKARLASTMFCFP